MDEIWRDIDGYKGLYQISNKGNVKSLYNGSERILKPLINNRGYLDIILYKNTTAQHRYIHRLVAEAFIPYTGLNPDSTEIKGIRCINHKDENPLNNTVDNLEWCDMAYNNKYGTRNERIGDSLSKPIFQYSKSGDFIREWKSAHEVERILGIANQHIIDCCKGRYKSSGGFIWKYKEKD